jgi:hypothetical protein
MLSAVAPGRPLATGAISTVRHGAQVRDGRERAASVGRLRPWSDLAQTGSSVLLSATARIGRERAAARPGG